jgi:hypothetical protein
MSVTFFLILIGWILLGQTTYSVWAERRIVEC